MLLISFCAVAQNCPVIPQPNGAVATSGLFVVSSNTPIILQSDDVESEANYLQAELLKTTGLTLAIQPAAGLPSIQLQKLTGNISSEAYHLKITPAGVVISSPTNGGLFYGLVSFLQLVRTGTVGPNQVTIPCWDINDAPHYAWRGLMLDESRHFFGKETVKCLLDWMAFYKLNRFHWHLTDAPGWRIEIKAYPRLALVGGIGTYSNQLVPAQYYTQEDIREIVAYAKERYITVIPEIDMPGHATAANRAYPEFNGGGSEKHPDFTFHPGNEATYSYLSRILKEVDALFPSQLIHLGGDEVSFGNEKWSSDPVVQRLMNEKKLNDVVAVERYFNHRMADTVFALNNKILLWDEAADSDLPNGKTVICWWRHDKISQLKKALAKGYQTILCPRLPFYFDFVQDTMQIVGRRWEGAFNALQNVYNFSVSDLPIAKAEQTLVLGVQAALWTEHISTKERLHYMLFPRIGALAETAWTEEKNKQYDRFLTRIKQHLELYRKSGLSYYNPFMPAATPEPVAATDY